MKRWFVVFACLWLSCDSPRPGEILLILDTPNDDDGAVAVTVTADVGYAISDVAAACNRCKAFKRVESEQEVRAIITGRIVSGLFLTLTVSDTRRPDRYTVRFDDGASRTYDVRSSMAGYSVVVAR